MIDDFKIITVSHRSHSVDTLGMYMVAGDESGRIEGRLQSMKASLGLDELFYLNTCNRVLYLLYTDHTIDQSFLNEFFQAAGSSEPSALKNVQVLAGGEAIAHVMGVASSLDSMVIGERQILGQFRKAYTTAQTLGLTADNLRLVDRYVVQAAKDVYANTRIGERPVSIVSLAIQEMRAQCTEPNPRILLIGAGATNRLVAKFLKKHGYRDIAVFNRSLASAQDIADTLEGRAFTLDALSDYKDGFDVLIVCTASTKPIVDTAIYEQLAANETDPKIIVDLAVPRNVDPAVMHAWAVTYIDVEKLRVLAEANHEFRKNAIGEANRRLKVHVQAFHKAYQQRQIEKALTQVPEEIRAVKERAIETVYKKDLDKLDPESRRLCLEMMDYMERKCVSVPMRVAKASSIL